MGQGKRPDEKKLATDLNLIDEQFRVDAKKIMDNAKAQIYLKKLDARSKDADKQRQFKSQ
jgi:hypothetical protein